MVINIDESSKTATISFPRTDGGITSKTVDLPALCASLGKVSNDSSMKIPKNCRGIITRGSTRGYLFVYEKCVHELPLFWKNYDTEDFGYLKELIPPKTDARFSDGDHDSYRLFRVPFPALAVITVGIITPDSDNTNRFQFKNQRVFALSNTSLPLDQMSYYIFPFTNVFDGSWNCCMGHDILKSVNEDSVEYFPQCIYSSVGNHDLDVSNGSHWNNSDNKETHPLGKVKSQYELITKLHKAGLTEYPIGYNKYLGKNLWSLFENNVYK